MTDTADMDDGQAEPVVPTYEQLLLTALFDHDGNNVGKATPKQFYAGWPVDHAAGRKFYVYGGRWVEQKIARYQAKFYYDLVARAGEFIATETDWRQVAGEWDKVPAYNQFRRAAQGEPQTFEKAAWVIAAHTVAYGDWVAAAKEEGVAGADELHPFDCFSVLGLLPACYNIDEFDAKALEKFRTAHSNFDATVLSATGQRKSRVLDDLASGKCVTLGTAVGIRDAIHKLTSSSAIGPVCGRPGRNRGRGGASTSEIVELHPKAV